MIQKNTVFATDVKIREAIKIYFCKSHRTRKFWILDFVLILFNLMSKIVYDSMSYYTHLTTT